MIETGSANTTPIIGTVALVGLLVLFALARIQSDSSTNNATSDPTTQQSDQLAQKYGVSATQELAACDKEYKNDGREAVISCTLRFSVKRLLDDAAARENRVQRSVR